MRPSYPGAEFVGKTVKFRNKKENSPSFSRNLGALNVVISSSCFAENGKEMYQNVKRPCAASY